MPGLLSHIMRPLGGMVAPGGQPRRAVSARGDIPNRSGRPLVTGASPDHAAGPRAPGGVPVYSTPVQPATPFAIYTMPRRRMGPVPKLAPGKQGSGLGMPVGAGFQSMQLPGFQPLENTPATQPSYTIAIPRETPVPWLTAGGVGPTYKAHDFAPAMHFFNQARSAGAWAQSSFSPQQRVLTPSQQAPMLRRPTLTARRQIPAAQPNPALYTAGYPTRAAMAARLGGGPIAVLGGNSQ
jgi:hypothetical protein